MGAGARGVGGPPGAAPATPSAFLSIPPTTLPKISEFAHRGASLVEAVTSRFSHPATTVVRRPSFRRATSATASGRIGSAGVDPAGQMSVLVGSGNRGRTATPSPATSVATPSANVRAWAFVADYPLMAGTPAKATVEAGNTTPPRSRSRRPKWWARTSGAPTFRRKLAQLVGEVVVEEPARPEDAGVVDQHADVQGVGGGEGREEVVRRQVERDGLGLDPVRLGRFTCQPPQPVLPAGDQHGVDAPGGEPPGECLADPGRGPGHDDPRPEAVHKSIHLVLPGW